MPAQLRALKALEPVLPWDSCPAKESGGVLETVEQHGDYHVVEDDGAVKIYYGGAGTVMALATTSVDQLIYACKNL